MKKIFLSFLIILISSNFAFTGENDWNIARTTHFIVYYKKAHEDFIDRVMEKAEDYYRKITDELGFSRFNFWLWDKRAKIYIYDTAQDYRLATSEPEWSAGCAEVRRKEVRTFVDSGGFLEEVLPHEMAHIIFRELVGFDNNAVPLWLDEGVACYQEKLKYSMADSAVKNLIGTGKFMPLEKLSGFGHSSGMRVEVAQAFYSESFSIVSFLIKRFGRERFVAFCENLRDKKDFEKALISSYPFKGSREMEEAWKGYL